MEAANTIDLWYYELLEVVYFNVLLELRTKFPARVFIAGWDHYSRQTVIARDVWAIAAGTQAPHEPEPVELEVSECEIPAEVDRSALPDVGVTWYSRASRARAFAAWNMPTGEIHGRV